MKREWAVDSPAPDSDFIKKPARAGIMRYERRRRRSGIAKGALKTGGVHQAISPELWGGRRACLVSPLVKSQKPLVPVSRSSPCPPSPGSGQSAPSEHAGITLSHKKAAGQFFKPGRKADMDPCARTVRPEPCIPGCVLRSRQPRRPGSAPCRTRRSRNRARLGCRTLRSATEDLLGKAACAAFSKRDPDRKARDRCRPDSRVARSPRQRA